MITSNKEEQKYELFINGYLKSSRIICDKILDNTGVGNTTEGQEEVKEAFIPAIYIFKHALELTVKLFILLTCPNKSKISHNTLDLFDESKENIKESIKQAYDKVKAKDNKDAVENNLFYKIAKYFIEEGKKAQFFLEELDKLARLVNKYNQPDYFVNINSNKGVKPGPDKENMLFRYPFDIQGNPHGINYLDVNNNFKHIQEVIKKVKKDTCDLRGISNRILLMINYIKNDNEVE